MELDQAKINTILKTLNDGEIVGDWTIADGFHVLSAATLENADNYSVIASSGAPFKLFYNTKTGETRLYLADMVIKR